MIQILLGRGLVAKIKCVRKAILANGIALEPISLGLVSDTPLVPVVTLKSDCLLVRGNVTSEFPGGQ